VNVAEFLDKSLKNTIPLRSFRSILARYSPKAVLEIESFFDLDEESSKVVSAWKSATAAGGNVLVFLTLVLNGRRLVYDFVKLLSPTFITSNVMNCSTQLFQGIRYCTDYILPRMIQRRLLT
jgi:hypothetical protein